MSRSFDYATLSTPKKTLKPSAGNPVAGDAFWPRPGAMVPLLRLLENGGSARIFGLRRMGKSSVLKEAERFLKADGSWLVISVRMDVQGGPGAFLGTILTHLDQTRSDRIRQKWIEVGGLTEALRAVMQALGAGNSGLTPDQEKELARNWDALSRHVSEQLGEIRGSKRIALFLDELPDFVNDRIAAGIEPRFFKAFFATLKHWREELEVSMVLSGSVGLVRILRKHGLRLDDIISMQHVPIPPLGRREAEGMLDALQANNPAGVWSRVIRDRLIDAADEGVPWLLQQARESLINAILIDPELSDEAAVLAKLDDILDPPPDRSSGGFAKARADIVAQFSSRLDDYDKIDPAWRTAALAALATLDGNGEVEVSRVRAALAQHFDESGAGEFLALLEEDGFVSLSEKRAGFGSALARRWYMERM